MSKAGGGAGPWRRIGRHLRPSTVKPVSASAWRYPRPPGRCFLSPLVCARLAIQRSYHWTVCLGICRRSTPQNTLLTAWSGSCRKPARGVCVCVRCVVCVVCVEGTSNSPVALHMSPRCDRDRTFRKLCSHWLFVFLGPFVFIGTSSTPILVRSDRTCHAILLGVSSPHSTPAPVISPHAPTMPISR